MEKTKIKAYGVLLYKVQKKSIKILLCKSVKSLNKWGCLKGMQQSGESEEMCAKREFLEECSIDVNINDFEEYFYQENEEKDIGIWLVNASTVCNLDDYFNEDKLYENYLSWENSKVKFFDINKLPSIKIKQEKLMEEIKDFLQNKNLSH